MGSAGKAVAVMVGANKGIGLGVSGCSLTPLAAPGMLMWLGLQSTVCLGVHLQLCKDLQAAGYDVLAVCRQSAPELDALQVTVVPGGYADSFYRRQPCTPCCLQVAVGVCISRLALHVVLQLL